MTLGEKLFEESGKVVGFKVTRVHPVEGMTLEVSFTSEINSHIIWFYKFSKVIMDESPPRSRRIRI